MRARPDEIRYYFAREKKPLAAVTLSGIAYNVGLAAGPLFEGLLAQCLYEILRGRQTVGSMAALAAAYVAVTVFVQGMRCWKRFYVRRFANDVSRTMKGVLYRGLLCRGRRQLAEEGVGGLMTRAVADVDACAEGMRKFTTEVFDTGVVMVVYAATLLRCDWRLTGLCCLFPPAAFFLAGRMKRPVTRSAAAYKESAGKLNGATLDRVSGALTYRVFGLEAGRDAAYDQALADYEKKAVAAGLWENTMQPLYQALSMLGVVPIIVLGGRNVLGEGWAQWDIAAFTMYLACFARLAAKAAKTAKLFNAVQKARVSWGRIKPLLSQAQTPAELPPAPPAQLTLTHLSFAYPGGEEILRDVSFSARPGEIVGITGAVACGKSTLGQVFLGEFPYRGSIRFGGRELRDLEIPAVVGYLGHQPELLSDSIRENILLGDTGSCRPWLEAVCMQAEVDAMEQGEKTVVGSGGIRLSGGQQARLALARTLCHRRPVLVLDDPFSAVDQATEAAILHSLRTAARDSVVLLLTHRLDQFETLDQVAWMEDGRLDIGTHRELMERRTAYRALYLGQKGGGGHGA
ncbi:ABC transporter ATP-binding protein [Dysosmobacter sp.]